MLNNLEITILLVIIMINNNQYIVIFRNHTSRKTNRFHFSVVRALPFFSIYLWILTSQFCSQTDSLFTADRIWLISNSVKYLPNVMEDTISSFARAYHWPEALC